MNRTKAKPVTPTGRQATALRRARLVLDIVADLR